VIAFRRGTDRDVARVERTQGRRSHLSGPLPSAHTYGQGAISVQGQRRKFLAHGERSLCEEGGRGLVQRNQWTPTWHSLSVTFCPSCVQHKSLICCSRLGRPATWLASAHEPWLARWYSRSVWRHGLLKPSNLF
jgi:hypothetical protein